MMEREANPPQRRKDPGIIRMGFSPHERREHDARSDMFAHTRQEAENELLYDLWKNIVRQLTTVSEDGCVGGGETTSVSMAVHLKRLKMFEMANEDVRVLAGFNPEWTPDKSYLIPIGCPAWRQYVEGAALALNPFAFSHRPYTFASDGAALAADWQVVFSDMIQGWAALVKEDPKIRELLESTAVGGRDARRARSE